MKLKDISLLINPTKVDILKESRRQVRYFTENRYKAIIIKNNGHLIVWFGDIIHQQFIDALRIPECQVHPIELSLDENVVYIQNRMLDCSNEIEVECDGGDGDCFDVLSNDNVKKIFKRFRIRRMR